MNRRDLLKNSFFTAVLASLPRMVWPSHVNGYTIGQILARAFPAAKAEMLCVSGWATPALRHAEREGRLMSRSLGVVVCEISDNGKQHCMPRLTEKFYPIEEISAPMMWSVDDDWNNPKEAQKITFVTHMLENAFRTHDDLLLERLGGGRAVVSREYRYEISTIPDRLSAPETFAVRLSSAIAFLV